MGQRYATGSRSSAKRAKRVARETTSAGRADETQDPWRFPRVDRASCPFCIRVDTGTMLKTEIPYDVTGVPSKDVGSGRK